MKIKKIKLKVTKRHILDGEAGSATSCPIALALEGYLEKKGVSIYSMSVDESNITLELMDEGEYGTCSVSFTADTPSKAAKFVTAFDNIREKVDNLDVDDTNWSAREKKNNAKLLAKIKPTTLIIPLPVL